MPADGQITVTLAFDRFGWSELERQAATERVTAGDLVARAAAHLATELERSRQATTVPRLPLEADREARSLTLELREETARDLRLEAERQGLALERLLEHAALLYLADLDAGIVAARIAERAEDDRA